MAVYDLKFPESVTKYKELAYLTKQLRYYEKAFKQFNHPNDELEAIRYRQQVDYWLEDNLIKK